MDRHIFTYGCLMFDPVWTRVVGGRYKKRTARLDGFCRRRMHGQIYPAVVPCSAEAHVEGVLYLDVDEADIGRLDRFEGKYYKRQYSGGKYFRPLR